jgi:hypothetical protein
MFQKLGRAQKFGNGYNKSKPDSARNLEEIEFR